MSSRLETATRSSTRRLLATAALAAVVGLGVSISAPAGSASAAPAAPASSSAADVHPDADGQAGPTPREYHITARQVENLKAGTLDPVLLARLICTGHHSGVACAKGVAYVLQAFPGVRDLRTCARGEGYTVVYPNTQASRCGD